MDINLDSCGECAYYRKEFLNYHSTASQGDFAGITGMRSLIDILLNEELNFEMEDFFNQNFETCRKRLLCIYDTEHLIYVGDYVENLAQKMENIQRTKELYEQKSKQELIPSLLPAQLYFLLIP